MTGIETFQTRQRPEAFPKNVCFVAENAYSVISESRSHAFGGMETQAWAFARSLQQLNCCDVSFAVSSPERFTVREHAGIRVMNRRADMEHVRRNVARHCQIQHAWPPVRVHQWRSSLLWQIPLLAITRPFRSKDDEQESIAGFYSALAADVVIAFGVSSLTTSVIEAAHGAGMRTIISCASNDDLRAEYHAGSSYINAYGDSGSVLARGLKSADQVFVQTEWQQQLAATNLKLSADVLPNPVDEQWTSWSRDADNLLSPLASQYPQLSGPFVLWTGRTERFHKRPAMAYDVARRLPQHQFVMVMNVTDPCYAGELHSHRPSNVLLLPPLPHPQFVALMSRATAFLSTGSQQYEGFPNVFLQAGILGVPVVSADCDFGILSRTGIGRSFEDSVPDMAESLREIFSSAEHRQAITESVAARTRELFGSSTVANRLWALLTTTNRRQPEQPDSIAPLA